MSSQPVRPPTVSLACMFLGLTSVLWLFYAGSTLSSWTSLETRQQITSMLEDAPVGASVDTLIEIARLALMVSAALAAASVILAIYAARGHQASRILLTVQAALLAVVFGITGVQGLIPSAFAIACIVLLWNADARRWFAAKNGASAEAADPPVLAKQATTEQSATLSGPAEGFEPAPGPTVSTSAAPIASAPGPASSTARPASPASPASPAARRAAIIALIGSSLGLLFGGVMYGVGSWRGAWLEEQLRADSTFGGLYSGFEDGALAQMAATLGGSIVALSLLGILAAVLLLSRRRLGRTLLFIASAGTLAMTIVTIPLGLVTAGLAVYVIVLLAKPEVGAWLSSE